MGFSCKGMGLLLPETQAYAIYRESGPLWVTTCNKTAHFNTQKRWCPRTRWGRGFILTRAHLRETSIVKAGSLPVAHLRDINIYDPVSFQCGHPVFERNNPSSLFKEAWAQWFVIFSWFYIVISITPFTLPTLVTDSYPVITYNFLIDIHFILRARW